MVTFRELMLQLDTGGWTAPAGYVNRESDVPEGGIYLDLEKLKIEDPDIRRRIEGKPTRQEEFERKVRGIPCYL